MIDILSADSTGLGVFDTNITRAKNLLNVQLGSLEYAPEIGVDMRYFLSEDFQFQNESFRSYLIQVLANNGINVSNVIQEVDALMTTLTFEIEPTQESGGLIAR